MKKYKVIDILWATSLFVITIVSLVLSIMSVAKFTMPDALRITLGVLDLIAIAVLTFTTVRKIIENKRNKNN